MNAGFIGFKQLLTGFRTCRETGDDGVGALPEMEQRRHSRKS